MQRTGKQWRGFKIFVYPQDRANRFKVVFVPLTLSAVCDEVGIYPTWPSPAEVMIEYDQDHQTMTVVSYRALEIPCGDYDQRDYEEKAKEEVRKEFSLI